jgi:hypothetical protein
MVIAMKKVEIPNAMALIVVVTSPARPCGVGFLSGAFYWNHA